MPQQKEYPIIIIMNNSNFTNEQSSLSNTDHNSKHNGRWTKQEHLKFLEGVQNYGKNWKKIEEVVKTRNGAQIRSHAQKFFNKLGINNDLRISESLRNEQENLIKNCLINSNVGHLNPLQSFCMQQELQNYTFPILDPITLLPVTGIQEEEVLQKNILPHQIWQQSNQLFKRGFLQTYVQIDNCVVPSQKENKSPLYVKKSSFTRCE